MNSVTNSSTKQATYFYKNGLTLFFIMLFAFSLLGQALTGWNVYNETLKDSGVPTVGLEYYLHTGHFFSATFENFESEFLQMALYVVLTISLRQKGSAESKKLFEKEEVDREPTAHLKAPWPVKRGGWIKTVYSHFWFETFQNWQSEFISIVAIVFFTIYLRQKGAPESKPVDAPHMETGK